jgi:hypothetical protein
MTDNLAWRKARASGGQGGNCIETATLPDGSHLLRDSKNPDGARLPVTAEHWRAFIGCAKSSRTLDIPALASSVLEGTHRS